MHFDKNAGENLKNEKCGHFYTCCLTPWSMDGKCHHGRAVYSSTKCDVTAIGIVGKFNKHIKTFNVCFREKNNWTPKRAHLSKFEIPVHRKKFRRITSLALCILKKKRWRKIKKWKIRSFLYPWSNNIVHGWQMPSSPGHVKQHVMRCNCDR